MSFAGVASTSSSLLFLVVDLLADSSYGGGDVGMMAGLGTGDDGLGSSVAGLSDWRGDLTYHEFDGG